MIKKYWPKLLFSFLLVGMVFNQFRIEKTFVKKDTLEKLAKNFEWKEVIRNHFENRYTFDLNIGVIQFFKNNENGFSISLDSVIYVQDGVELAGTIGNPTNLLIGNLTLNFSAERIPDDAREQYFEAKKRGDQLASLYVAENVGTAQTVVGFLRPGGTTNFKVTIPNVKQSTVTPTPSFKIWFSGERYSYLR